MNRSQFLRELRKTAKARGLELEVFEDRGKGSHYRVSVAGRISTIKSGDLSPTYVKLVRKQLGLD